jgi:hypothetical protein
MNKLICATLILLCGCDKFQGAVLDAKRLGKDAVQTLSVSQAQHDAEALCAARINSDQPRPNTSGYPVNYPTVNPPQFKTQVLGYDKYEVQTLLSVPNAAAPYIATCIVDHGKITNLVSD